MSESMRMWIEVSFNTIYLVVVWALVILMARRHDSLAPEARRLNKLFTIAFGLLALGDSGHVGFRVLAYAMGGLQANAGLIGAGAVATAYTVTLFYVVVLMIWHARFEKSYGWFGYLLFVAAAVRMVVMLFPQNAWGSSPPPFDWSLYRNIPLMIQGLGVAFLILRDAFAEDDIMFKWVGAMILTSYAFYIPVILFVRQMPIVGMLMIPKTLAYVAIAFIAYTSLAPKTGRSSIGRAETS